MNRLKWGVGFNLRLEWLDFVLAAKPPVNHLEIIVDNWLSPGPHHKKLELVREDYEILFHCVGMNLGGKDPMDYGYLAEIKNLAQRYQPYHISDHLCFQHHQTHYFHDLLPIPLNEDSLENCITRVRQVMDFIDHPFLIENLSYYVEYESSTMGEGTFLAQLCQASGTKVLLDLNNIWVNQENLGIKLSEYEEQISSNLIGEIHLAGPEKQGAFYIDTHASVVQDEVKKWFQSIIKRVNVPVIYERDNNLPSPETMVEICQELERLW